MILEITVCWHHGQYGGHTPAKNITGCCYCLKNDCVHIVRERLRTTLALPYVD